MAVVASRAFSSICAFEIHGVLRVDVVLVTRMGFAFMWSVIGIIGRHDVTNMGGIDLGSTPIPVINSTVEFFKEMSWQPFGLPLTCR